MKEAAPSSIAPLEYEEHTIFHNELVNPDQEAIAYLVVLEEREWNEGGMLGTVDRD